MSVFLHGAAMVKLSRYFRNEVEFVVRSVFGIMGCTKGIVWWLGTVKSTWACFVVRAGQCFACDDIVFGIDIDM